MDHQAFWDEELRAFPHGGRGAAVWVVRRSAQDPAAPLQLLKTWDCGNARRDGMAGKPPLGTLLRAMADDREELIRRGRDTAMWVEPLRQGGAVIGCLGIWFDAAEPWREGIFLWGQRLVPRLVPLLGLLDPQGPLPGESPGHPTLFPLPAVTPRRGAAKSVVTPGGVPGAREALIVPLPRPATVPGIPGCVGISAEMVRLGLRLANIARSDVNVLLHGESGTGKEIIARALHVASDRQAGPFVAQNCAALAESTIYEKPPGANPGGP